MLLKVVLGVVAMYVVACTLMFFNQEQFLFHPTKPTGPPAAHGLDSFQAVTFKTSDGVTLTGWLHEAQGRNKAIVLFYGNADSLAPYAGFFKRFASAGYSVLGVNYRGYGGSNGAPSETGFYRDANAALALMAQRVPVEKITLIGNSIGTGVAVDLASRNAVAAVVLISPFTSVVDRAAEIFWYLPVRMLSKYAFASIAKIGEVSASILIVHGDNDTLIPLQHGTKLYAAARQPKRMEIFEGADHFTMDLDRIAGLVIEAGAER